MKRFRIGARLLKSTLAVTVAIIIAQQVGLHGTIGLAPLVALVTVQRSFHHSLVQSVATLGSVLLGGALGVTFGYLFGVTPLAYGMVTLVGIFLSCKLGMQQQAVLTTLMGIGTIFSGATNLGIYALLQILTAVTGGASALGINYLFNPKYSQELNIKLKHIEEDIRGAIDFIVDSLQEPGSNNKEFMKQIARAKKSIQEAWDIIWLLGEVHNKKKAFQPQHQALEIFSDQLYRLELMHRLALRIPVGMPQAGRLAKLLRIVQRIQYNTIRGKRKEYALVEYAVENLDRLFTVLEMPCNRNEFVTRASLYHMLEELKHYYRETLKLPVINGDIHKETGYGLTSHRKMSITTALTSKIFKT